MVAGGELKKEPVLAAVLVKEAHQLLNDQCSDMVSLDLEFGATVYCDAVQVHQVLMNLIRNACEAVLNERDPQVRVKTEVVGERVRFSVQDNGPGITAEQMTSIFDAFVSSKEAGMGIGLAISRTIIEAHGGVITVEQASSGGASFRFELPIADNRAALPSS